MQWINKYDCIMQRDPPIKKSGATAYTSDIPANHFIGMDYFLTGIQWGI